jgi:tRNA G10  N-methylase Trm11
MRCQLEIITSSSCYAELLNIIEHKNIYSPGFKAEYLVLHGDDITYEERLQKSRDIGYHIGGKPDFKNPIILYSLCHYEGIWYFGKLTRHNKDWHKHRKKPATFSNSIGINIAKSLVALASKGDVSNQLLDACCGVGTVMLEACISKFQIDGNDINWKACRHARENLAHFDYANEVSCSDIKDLEKTYDGVIIDLPYNMYARSTDDIMQNIISSAAKLASRVVIVSVADIEPMITASGLQVIDFCTVEKRGHSTFTRRIWVCETDRSTL